MATRNPGGAAFLERLRALQPNASIVVDLGVDADGVLAGVPTAYVDHHDGPDVPAHRPAVRTRLPQHAMLGANRGYVPGLVALSTRTARVDIDLPVLLQAIDVGPHGGSYGHGHDQASAGHPPPEAFGTLCDALGFAPKIRLWAAGGGR